MEEKKDVGLLILRRNIDSEDTAEQIEMAFIQTLDYLAEKKRMPPLTNEQKNSNKQGDANFVSYENRIDIIAEPFDPAKIGDQKLEKVWFFNIKDGYEERKTEAQGLKKTEAQDLKECLYNATCKYWRIGKKAASEDKPSYAIGLIEGKSRSLIKINEWREAEEKGKGRFEIIGDEITCDNNLYGIYVEKDFSSILKNYPIWLYGQCLVFKLEQDKYTPLRGAPKDKKNIPQDYPRND